MLKQVDLFFHFRRNQRMVVPHTDAKILGHQVHVFLPVDIPQIMAESAFQHNRLPVGPKQIDGRRQKSFAFMHHRLVGPVGLKGRVLVEFFKHDGPPS